MNVRKDAYSEVTEMEPIEIILRIQIGTEGKINIIPNVLIKEVPTAPAVPTVPIVENPITSLSCNHYLISKTCRGCRVNCPAKSKYGNDSEVVIL